MLWLQFLRLGRVGYTKIMQVSIPLLAPCDNQLKETSLEPSGSLKRCWPSHQGFWVNPICHCAAQNCHTVAMYLCEGIEKSGYFNIISARNPVPGLPLCTFSLKVGAAVAWWAHPATM